MANHFRLDFDLVEDLAVVDTDNGANHFRDNDHVTEVGLDNSRLLVSGSFLLGLAKLLDKTHGLALQAALESSAGTSMDEFHELLRGQIQELVKVDTAVGELAEGSLSLRLLLLISLWVSGCYVSTGRCQGNQLIPSIPSIRFSSIIRKVVACNCTRILFLPSACMSPIYVVALLTILFERVEHWFRHPDPILEKLELHCYVCSQSRKNYIRTILQP